MTLVELAAMIAVGGAILGSAFAILVRLQRLAATDTAGGVRAELASELLRRDLAAGPVAADAGGVRIRGRDGEVVWRRDAGWLMRGDRQMLRVDEFAVAATDGRLVVAFTPAGLPARRIEAQP